MCFILLGLKAHPDFPFILAANRDEFYGRPAKEAGFWQEHPEILAGRDLEAGGTWLGINRSGRISALTNFRNPGSHDPKRESRGNIVTNWLISDVTIENYLYGLDADRSKYNGFSLLAGNLERIYFYSNRSDTSPVLLDEGVFALSNHLLDTPWPKAVNGKQRFENIVNSENNDLTQALLELLSDKTKAPDEHLPDTGIEIELERYLSPIFIETPDYGTRCSTVILADESGKIELTERTYGDGSCNQVHYNIDRRSLD